MDDEEQGPIVTFARAVRKGAPTLTALYGESGSGKTFSGLLIARGLAGPNGRIALLDTETGRGMYYADDIPGGYEYAELTAPFTPERYIRALDVVESLKLDALVIDSASHEWEGIGGVVETADANGKQGLVKWAKPKARHKRFMQRLLTTRTHLIICMRAKEKLVQVKNPKTGKEEIASAGFVSVQDKRFIYEMTLQLFLPRYDKRDHIGIPVIEKCPQGLLPAFPEGARISVQTGEMIRQWVDGGAPVDRAYEALKRRGEQVAADGTEALKMWWEKLTVADKKAMQPNMANLKSVAAEADRHEEPEGGDATDLPDGQPIGQPDPSLDSPFGDRTAA